MGNQTLSFAILAGAAGGSTTETSLTPPPATLHTPTPPVLHFLVEHRDVVDFFAGFLHRLQIEHCPRHKIFTFAEFAFDSIEHPAGAFE